MPERSSPAPPRTPAPRPVAALRLTLLLPSLLALASCAPLPPDLAVPGELSDRWEVRLDPELGTPARMTNRTLDEGDGATSGQAIGEAAAEAAARAVLEEENERWFRARPGIDEWRLTRSFATGWLREMRFEQVYRGLPVAGGGYRVHVLPSGRVGTLEGRFHPEIQIDTTPLLDAVQAEERARAAHPPGTTPRLRPILVEDEGRRFESRFLVVLPLDRQYRLAWVVRIRIDSGFTRVYVDARTGDLLGAQFLGLYEG